MDIWSRNANKFLVIGIVVVVAWVGIYIFASIMSGGSDGRTDLYEEHGVERMHPDKAHMLGETDRPRYD